MDAPAAPADKPLIVAAGDQSPGASDAPQPVEEEHASGSPPPHTPAYEQLRAMYSRKRIIWARLRPGPAAITPDGIVEFVVKFAQAPVRPVKITFRASGGHECTTVVRPRPRQLVISAVTFPEGLDRMFCFLENRGDGPIKINSIELDGLECVGSPMLRLTSSVIPPGGKQVACFAWSKPLTRGTFHTIRARTTDGVATAERVRVVAGFPVASDMGGVPPGTGLDGQFSFHYPDDEPGNPPTAASIPAAARDAYVFSCAMHTYRADHTRSAEEIFRRCQHMLEVAPALSCSLHLCRIRPEEGYGKFGETADVLRTNPFVSTVRTGTKDNATPLENAVQLTRLARLGAEPRPVYCVVATHAYEQSKVPAAPADVRALAYTLLGQGAKGLFYRHSWWADDKAAELNDELRHLTAEVRAMTPWLAVADVASLAQTDGTGITARTLLAPDKGIVLILVRTGETAGAVAPANTQDSSVAGRLPPTHTTLPRAGDAVSVTLDLPPWLEPVSLLRVTPHGLDKVHDLGAPPTPEGGASDRRLSLRLPSPDAAVAYVIPCEWRGQ